MNAEVAEYVTKKCPFIKQKKLAVHVRAHMSTISTHSIMGLICTDYLRCVGYEYILVVIDQFHKVHLILSDQEQGWGGLQLSTCSKITFCALDIRQNYITTRALSLKTNSSILSISSVLNIAIPPPGQPSWMVQSDPFLDVKDTGRQGKRNWQHSHLPGDLIFRLMEQMDGVKPKWYANQWAEQMAEPYKIAEGIIKQVCPTLETVNFDRLRYWLRIPVDWREPGNDNLTVWVPVREEYNQIQTRKESTIL